MDVNSGNPCEKGEREPWTGLAPASDLGRNIGPEGVR